MWEEIDSTFQKVDHFMINGCVPSLCIKESILEAEPVFTIVIPTYKRSNLLVESINSAINQNWEGVYDILIVDNNPMRNDETENLIEASYKEEKRLSYYKNYQNLGMTGNWNRMCELAKGRWVVMLHDDDILFQNALKSIYSVIRQEKEIDAIFLTTANSENDSYTKQLQYVRLRPWDFKMSNCGNVVGTTIRRSKMIELGGFNDDYYPSGDYHFWSMLSLKSNVFKILCPNLGYYRIGEVNESVNLETLEGFLKKDAQIMMGIANYQGKSNWSNKLYLQYIVYYSLIYVRRWKNRFKYDKKNTELESIEKRILSAVHWYSYPIYSIYQIIYRGYCKSRLIRKIHSHV